MKTGRPFFVTAILLLLIPFISHSQQGTATLEFPNATPSLEVVKIYLNALQQGDITAMGNQLSRDAVINGLGGGEKSINTAQHKDYYTNSTSQYTHKISRDYYLPVKVTDNWNEGEWILSWGINTVTNKESKKTIEIPYHVAYLVENGKIKQVSYYYDMLNIMDQQGFKITAPGR